MQAFDLGHSAATSVSRPQVGDHVRLSGELAAEAVAAFATVMDELGRIREFHAEICGNLDQFSDLVANGNGEDDAIETLEADVGALATALQRFSTLAVSPEAHRRLRAVRGELGTIDQCGQVLTAIASLMGTTVASLGLGNLGAFINELRKTVDDIQNSATAVTGHLDHLDERGARLLNSCNRAGFALGALPERVAAPRQRLDKLGAEERRAADAVTGRARQLTQDGRHHLKSFVSAMQFSDRLAQRLDHLSAMLGYADGHVARLAAAHAQSCSDDIACISADVRTTMGLLAELGHAGAQVFSEGELARTIAAALSARAELTQLVTEELSSVQKVVENAKAEAEYTTEMASATNASFDGLKDASKNLTLASFNSMLVSNRYSKACGPMKVLSKEVRQIASDCLGAVDRARSSIGDMTSGSEAAQQDLVTAAGALEERVGEFRGRTSAGEQRLADINAMRKTSQDCAQNLLYMVDAVTDSMARVDHVGSRLSTLATSLLEAQQTDAPVDAARISAIWDSYTMDEERQVHIKVFPDIPSADLAAGPADTADDDIDDLLF